MRYRVVAKWIPGFKKYIKQLCVSSISFLTLPFYAPKEDGVKKFFSSNYYEKQDELVFDGSTNGYYSKVELLTNFKLRDNISIIDLGSGQGSLYAWLKRIGIPIKQYIGIDFSIRGRSIDKHGILVNDDISNVYKYLSNSNDIVFMCNSLCYIGNELFIKILDALNTGNELYIIDPAPNLFWDAHFNGIKPIYRKYSAVVSLLMDHGFSIEGTVQDYLLKIGSLYISPLSYCIHSKKQ